MELVRFPSHGGFSVRSIFSFVLAVIIAAILWTTLSGAATYAAGEATWQNGTTILYDNHGYNADTEFKDPSGTIPEGAKVYKTPVQTPDDRSSNQKVFVLYFSPGVDPPEATSAQYVAFDYNNGTLSNPHDKKEVVATPADAAGNSGTSCAVSGIGWIICPVSEFLADAMDNLFNVVAGMLNTRPLVLGDTNNSMYVAWNIMRTIANIAFVIAFLIIIYSQVTSTGVSNYGLKKLIPRLIVAAVLVNVSFFITALAIDISNILGYSIQDIFNAIREQTFHMTNDTTTGVNSNAWGTVTALVLAGGGLYGAYFYAADAALYFLVPLLIGVAFVVLFVFIILAARQAIITLLVIVSPLAFVANLLPNTEKWFEKWKDLFFTMLIFFPAFSLVFGGSQLAGQIIIQNAADNIMMLLFGMAVQIAPLAITPLLLKFSGGLLGRIAQLANNPRKGLVDRSRNWANEKKELRHQQQLSKTNLKRGSISAAAVAQRLDGRSRLRKERIELYKLRADNRWHEDKKHEKVHLQMHEAETDKQMIGDKQKTHVQSIINNPNSKLHLQNARLEAGKRALEDTVKITEGDIKEYETGHTPAGASTELRTAISQMQTARRSSTIEGMRASNADGKLQRDLAEALKNSATLRDRAGGIQPLGANSVLASAVSAVRRADAEDIKNIQDASDLAAGDLAGAAKRMTAAIQAGNSIEARAYQNMLVTAGGAGMDQFRQTMIDIGPNIPADVSELMRDNLLSNHGAIKAKSNDLIDWAAKGGILESHTRNAKSWAGLSDKDFINQHPKTQAYALDANSFSRERAEKILAADIIEGNVLTEAVKERLRNIQ